MGFLSLPTSIPLTDDKVWLCDALISSHVQGPMKADVEIPFEEVLEKAKAGDPKAQTEVRISVWGNLRT